MQINYEPYLKKNWIKIGVENIGKGNVSEVLIYSQEVCNKVDHGNQELIIAVQQSSQRVTTRGSNRIASWKSRLIAASNLNLI